MPLFIVRDSITKMDVDAIVNAAKRSLLGGGGVDGAIHAAAGPGLLAECRTLGGCETGQAKITGGYNLKARHVIHTVGPVWNGGHRGEEKLLRSCYRSSLELAQEAGCESVAFPLISAGVYGYPKDEALRIAVEEIRAFLLDGADMTVYIAIYDRAAYRVSRRLMRGVRERVDERYVSEQTRLEGARAPLGSASYRRFAEGEVREHTGARASLEAPERPRLDEMMANLDEGFSQTLLRLIDERGMSDAECYKRANVDRRLFSKIRSNPQYRPSKQTAIAFALALELDLDQTSDLLRRAGYALSHSSKFDVIVEYFIECGAYDVFEINEVLFEFDQPLIGG